MASMTTGIEVSNQDSEQKYPGFASHTSSSVNARWCTVQPTDGPIENLCGMIMVRKNLLVSCSIEHRHQPWRWDSESEEEDIEEIPAHDGSYDGDAVSFIQTRKRLIKNRQRTHGKKRKTSKRTIMLKEPYFCPKDLSLTKQRKKKNQNIHVLRRTRD